MAVESQRVSTRVARTGLTTHLTSVASVLHQLPTPMLSTFVSNSDIVSHARALSLSLASAPLFALSSVLSRSLSRSNTHKQSDRLTRLELAREKAHIRMSHGTRPNESWRTYA